MDSQNGIATFVIPHWRDDKAESLRYLNETLNGIFNQTDDGWNIVIIDDSSPSENARQYLNDLENKYAGRIKVIFNDVNRGPGYCRNLGVKWAYQNKSPFVLYNDADDISNPKRLEIAKNIFAKDSDASVIYSSFSVIDENNNTVPKEELTQCIVEILDGHRHNPPQGVNAWIDIGTEKGYTNLTSATVVKTELAYKFPFPNEHVSEDTHTWLRYSAGGDKFIYTDLIPTLYRIPQHTKGTSTISRVGGRRKFFEAKAKNDTDGFVRAFEIAVTKNKISPEKRDELMLRFHIKLAETFYKEKEYELLKDQIACSKQISLSLTEQIIHQKGFDDWYITYG